ncbi:prolyl oligopeptidase family serine peptidase [Abyssibius alkaniclasticus]|uniref:S9 family peptidase n=1 Tax=Abyssibius alkaniclasticus TaxID=2881234 RepID=UPI0023648273|nr:prolyl oligopeptidase family serine peptidase [Abyssibius alkaniclasticus]UPH72626.1 prolyl oligopeptidase family serine peptidase [Abyssibius alkaniclasticus]
MDDIETRAALLASLPGIEALHVSADGNWVFWSWAGPHENTEIYCAPTDGSASPKRLTTSRDHAYIRAVNHNGSQAIFARSPDSCERDQLFLLSRDGAESPLTHAQRDHYVFGGAFSPDGNCAIWIADYDYTAGQPTSGGWIWVQDLASDTRRVLHKMEGPFESGAEFSPDGAHILWRVMSGPAGATQLWIMCADGSEAREVVRASDTSPITGAWLDADTILFIGEGTTNDYVGRYTLSTNKAEALAEAADFNPQGLIAGPDGRCAVIAYADSRCTPELLAGHSRTPLANPTGRGSILPLGSHPDGSWIVEAYDAGAPHEILRLHPDGRCTTIARAPHGAACIRPESLHWTSPDGTRVQGWLYKPKGTPRGHVTYVHGGPTWHSEDWTNPKIQFWLSCGYSVLDPNYRGSTGRGMAWRKRVKEDGWGGREQADIRAGTEAVIALGLAQPGRIAVAGNSYGGFSSWYAITRHADLVNAAIPMCGMYKLDIDYNETEMPWGKSYSEEMMGGSPAELPEKYANASPGNFVDNIKGRVMVVHGLADTNVGPANTHVAVQDMQEKGINHTVLLFADEGHGVTRRSNLAQYLAASAQFLEDAFGHE